MLYKPKNLHLWTSDNPVWVISWCCFRRKRQNDPPCMLRVSGRLWMIWCLYWALFTCYMLLFPWALQECSHPSDQGRYIVICFFQQAAASLTWNMFGVVCREKTVLFAVFALLFFALFFTYLTNFPHFCICIESKQKKLKAAWRSKLTLPAWIFSKGWKRWKGLNKESVWAFTSFYT